LVAAIYASVSSDSTEVTPTLVVLNASWRALAVDYHSAVRLRVALVDDCSVAGLVLPDYGSSEETSHRSD
jgi:hypothetical protein